MSGIKTKRYKNTTNFTCIESDCNRQWNNVENAREKAYNHARNTGHVVAGAITTVYKYN